MLGIHYLFEYAPTRPEHFGMLVVGLKNKNVGSVRTETIAVLLINRLREDRARRAIQGAS